MNSSDVVVKTAEGRAEVAARSRKLPPRLRTLLILIDGSVSVAQLTDAAAKFGAPGDSLETLLLQGLIAVKPAAVGPAADTPAVAAVPVELSEADRFRAAQRFMNDSVVNALGFRAFFFTLKLEKCGSRADLSALLQDYAKTIAKGSGDDVARVLKARVREMLE